MTDQPGQPDKENNEAVVKDSGNTPRQPQANVVGGTAKKQPAPAKAGTTKNWSQALLWIVLLLVILLTGGGFFYGWQALQAIKPPELPTDLVTDAELGRDINALRGRFEDGLSRLSEQVLDTGQNINELRSQLDETARRIMTADPTGRTDWLIAETEYLLRLANQRLLLEKDHSGALKILQAADGVLAETDEAALFPVRRAVSREIADLKAVGDIDREGLYLKIDALIEQVRKLDNDLFFQDSPLLELGLSETSTEDVSNWQSRMDATLERLEQYLVIRRRDEPVEPLMAPEQIYYLKQNLRLMLEQAQLALLDRNQEVYARSLEKAEAWIEEYFRSTDPVTKAMVATLGEVSQASIDPELPDISESLRLLKGLIEAIYERTPGQDGGDA